MRRNLLIIDDEDNMRHMLQAMLSKNGYTISLAENGVVGLNMVRTGEFDFILCDIRMPEMDGITFLNSAKQYLTDTTVIMMSAYGTIDLAIEAIKQGAYDFISKPFKTDEVVLALRKAEEREMLKQENLLLKQKIKNLQGTWSFGAMVGENQAMRALVNLAEKVSKHNSTVLITGESGTGKELLAKGIYLSGNKSEKPFVAVNCGSIPANLLESEFFGYVRGAFTGADSDKQGLFEEADGGTLFLDEIGEMPLPLQVKLLRVLQEKEVRPVGSGKHVAVDVRILAATAKDLEKEVERGTFRRDLFFRLSVITLKIPPLRKRKDDIPVLCHHLLEKLNRKLHLCVKSISPAVMSQLLRHSWPGNVRELENVLESGFVFTEGDTLQAENLPANLFREKDISHLEDLFSSYSMKNGKSIMEKWFITRALEETAGNKSRAADLLEVSYPSLLAKIKQYEIG